LTESSYQRHGEVLSLWVFLAATIAVVFGLLALVWVGLPGPDAHYRLISPSGQLVIHIDESCGEFACSRGIVVHSLDAGAEGAGRACVFAVATSQPIFSHVEAGWSADERAVALTFTSDSGETTSVALDFASDCGVV
jgi:hypothetical protein